MVPVVCPSKDIEWRKISLRQWSNCAVHAPRPNGSVLSARDKILPVWKKSDGFDDSLVMQHGNRLVRTRIPDANGAVVASRDELFSVGRISNDADNVNVILQRLQLLPRVEVPDVDMKTRCCGYDFGVVGRETNKFSVIPVCVGFQCCKLSVIAVSG